MRVRFLLHRPRSQTYHRWHDRGGEASACGFPEQSPGPRTDNSRTCSFSRYHPLLRRQDASWCVHVRRTNGVFGRCDFVRPKHELSSTVDSYYPNVRTWTSMPPLPFPHCNHKQVMVDGVIYVLGGSIEGHELREPGSTLDCLRPETKQ
jgi:hypothetical protein